VSDLPLPRFGSRSSPAEPQAGPAQALLRCITPVQFLFLTLHSPRPYHISYTSVAVPLSRSVLVPFFLSFLLEARVSLGSSIPTDNRFVARGSEARPRSLHCPRSPSDTSVACYRQLPPTHANFGPKLRPLPPAKSQDHFPPKRRQRQALSPITVGPAIWLLRPYISLPTSATLCCAEIQGLGNLAQAVSLPILLYYPRASGLSISKTTTSTTFSVASHLGLPLSRFFLLRLLVTF
jgi:hypothetical protein